MIELDGAQGEGGGQMLRTAVAFSLLTGRPFRMRRIRANRPQPGLKAQHLHGLRAVALLGPVKVEGAVLGSRELAFHPAPLRAANATVDVGTAGALTLVLQVLLPAALRATGCSRFRLIGGTDVAWSPPVDWLRNVALGPAMKRSYQMRLDVVRRGFYPAGGGELVFEAAGWKDDVAPLEWGERGRLVQIRTLAFASEFLRERRVAERMSEAAARELERHGAPVHAEVEYGPTSSPGCVISCVADLAGGQKLGSNALGEKGTPAEDVGREAGERLSVELASGAPVDEQAADQLVPWLALSGGEFKASRLSDHTTTNLRVVEAFIGNRFEVEGTRIRCKDPFHPVASQDVRIE
jgi:RNA 3'-terminal phosphate cyclase (GTP)